MQGLFRLCDMGVRSGHSYLESLVFVQERNHLLQVHIGGIVTVEIIHHHLCFTGTRPLHSDNDRQGDLALLEVIVDWFAELCLWGDKIEGIVGHLKCHADMVSKSTHLGALRWLSLIHI